MPFAQQHSALLCLNLQSDYTNPASALCVDNAADIIRSIQHALAFARRERWPIVHMHSRAPNLCVARGNSIMGIEPRADEPVLFKKRYSALRQEELMTFLRDMRIDTTYVVGFALALDCVATAYDAIDFGVPLTCIEQAMGTPPMAGICSQALSRMIYAILSPLIEISDINDVFRTPGQLTLTSRESQ
jgi:nicotinamidase-related amidase